MYSNYEKFIFLYTLLCSFLTNTQSDELETNKLKSIDPSGIWTII
jgi:hypothetical protein